VNVNTDRSDDAGSRPEAGQEQVVQGISLSPSGEATVDSSLADVLFDLAVKLDDALPHPVDVQHVLAAIVLAARAGQLASDRQLAADDPYLEVVLAEHVRTVFRQYGGKLGRDD
jgi:hypothetical protein